MPVIARNFEKTGDQAVQIQVRIGRTLRAGRLNKESAASPALDPAAARQVTIGSPDSVGMDVKTACKLTGTRESFAGCEVGTDDAENHLRGQLFRKRYLAGLGQPQLHFSRSVQSSGSCPGVEP